MTERPLTDWLIPTDYEAVFRDRTLIITGVGRSGTSVLGKLVGSLAGAFYLYEPAAMKLVPFLAHVDPTNAAAYGQLARALFFEDHFLQLVHGRTLNFNTRDESYVGNYMEEAEYAGRWESLRSRADALAYFERERPLLVVKTPEFQPLMGVASAIFPGVRFLHITRDGNDVIGSTVARRWYDDAYMNGTLVDWVEPAPAGAPANLPFYLDGETGAAWGGWDNPTRAAAVWRTLTEAGLAYAGAHPVQVHTLSYEALVADPAGQVGRVAEFVGTQVTDITRRQIAGISAHRASTYPDFAPTLAEPERSRFRALQARLGYRRP